MVFSEASNGLIFGIAAFSFIMAYIGMTLKENQLPLKIFFILLSMLTGLLAIGTGIASTHANCATPLACTTAEQAVVDSGNWTWLILLTSFIFVIGYFIVLLIRWALVTLAAKKEEQFNAEKDLGHKGE